VRIRANGDGLPYTPSTLPHSIQLKSNISSLLDYPLCEGVLSFNPLVFTHVPPDVTTSKLCVGLMFGNCVWHSVYKIYGVFW
jgi:hypothetical protein